MNQALKEQVEDALSKATATLLAARHPDGSWEGELSSSALSTATAVTALAVAEKHGGFVNSALDTSRSAINRGLRWLADNQNRDEGWGDTTNSVSNISTTTLCWAAFGAGGSDASFAGNIHAAERWLAGQIGVAHSAFQTSHSALARAIIARYGKDRTFSVPILTMCALAGRLGTGRSAWRHVIPLPFELAAFPHQLFAALRLPVVSYALPALIAIGQVRHVHAPSRNPLARAVRHLTRGQTLRVLEAIQPGNGGFLEATPLTSFVTMSLAAAGHAEHLVTRRGLDFLLKSQRDDGSWPIDTNLATWCTTLSVEALSAGAIPAPQSTIAWLLHQQYRVAHPYTHAAPGGWAWTDLPGGVPDADDTAGALVALARMRSAGCGVPDKDLVCAAELGIDWLLKLQNRDGGIPTFCRGWGALPFDRSSADITAHAIRAWTDWHDSLPATWQGRIRRAIGRAVGFFRSIQESDGAFSPLWFGNQFAPDEANRVYGTSRVLKALVVLAGSPFADPAAGSVTNGCVQWLLNAQNRDGGWGSRGPGDSSVEETALAVEALALAERIGASAAQSLDRGVRWLCERVESGAWREPSPIGFYFAKLWYFEKLYPMIFTAGALRAASCLPTSDNL